MMSPLSKDDGLGGLSTFLQRALCRSISLVWLEISIMNWTIHCRAGEQYRAGWVPGMFPVVYTAAAMEAASVDALIILDTYILSPPAGYPR